MKAGLFLGVGAVHATRGESTAGLTDGRSVAGPTAITQPRCFPLDHCTFGPKSIVYIPRNPIYAVPKQCAASAPVNITATSALNRRDITLSTSSNVPLLFDSIAYADIEAHGTSFATFQLDLQTTLDKHTTNNAVAPGVFRLDASYFVCKDVGQLHRAAPLQCQATTCIAYPDTWPPKSLERCPSYMSVNNVTYDATAFYSHLKDPFEELKWSAVVDAFEKWGHRVENFPCVAGQVATSRCDSFTVQTKRLGRHTTVDMVRGNDGDKVRVLRELDAPTAVELNELKAVADTMDLTLDRPIPDPAAVCTKCVHTTRVLKEWVHPASCASPLDSTPQCRGTDACTLNHCVTFVPMDLFSASLEATQHALETTERAKRSWIPPYLKDEVVYHAASDTIRLVWTADVDVVMLNVESLVQVATPDGDWVKSQVTWTVQRPNGRPIFQRWTPLQDSRVAIPTTQRQKPPTVVAFAVRSWTPCGQIASKNVLLRVFRQDSIVVGTAKAMESLTVRQDNGTLSFFRAMYVTGALCFAGGVLWSLLRHRTQRDQAPTSYQLVRDANML